MSLFVKFAMAGMLVTCSSAAWAQCNPTEAEEGIKWCAAQCSVPHSQAQCDASGRMASYAKNGDALGVRNNFGECQTGNDDNKIKQRANVEECFLHNQAALLRAACNVYGCPPPTPPTPPTPPPPTLKKIEFNQPAKPTNIPHLIVADFLLDGKGSFRDISTNFTRDGEKANIVISMITFRPEGDKLHITITANDPIFANVLNHKYSVAGAIEIVIP